MSSRLRFCDLRGHVSLNERGGKDENDFWQINELIDCNWSEMQLDVALRRENDDGDDDESVEPVLRIEIACFRVENKETGRAFHCDLHATVGRRQAQQLHAYLGYLLEHEWA